jgi:hypothetical protein
MKKLILPSVMLLASLLSASAHAGVSATGNAVFSYTLVDLDPNDGITPSITFDFAAGGPRTGYLSVSLSNQSAGIDQWQYTFGSAQIYDHTKSLSNPAVGSGSATITAGTGLSKVSGMTANVTASSNILPAPAPFERNLGAGASATPLQGDYYLSANTELILSADVSLYASASSGTGGRANASASFSMYLQGPTVQLSDREAASLKAISSGLATDTKSLSNIYSVSYANTSSTTQRGYIETSLSSGGTNYALYAAVPGAPVPEPETYAMLLAGLGLVARVTRRKAKRK